KTIRFGEEARFIGSFLQQIAGVLVRDTPPSREELIAFRMRMCDVERIIQFRCCAIDDQPGPRPIWSVQDRVWRKKHGLPLDYTTRDVYPGKRSKGVTASAHTTASSD